MTHAHHDIDVVDRGGPATGMVLGILALLLLAVIAFALLWTQPWDDDGAVDTTPGISDNSGGGTGGGSGTDGGTGGGGTDGGTGGGTGGGEQPQPAQ